MKKIMIGITVLAAAAAMAGTCFAQESTVDAAKIVEDIATVQAFTMEAVPEADINSIVLAGVNAPSSMNTQPWHFSVVTNNEVLQQIEGGGMSMGDSDGESAGDSGDSDGESAGTEAPEMTGDSSGNAAMPTATTSAKAGLSDAPLVIIVSCKDGSEFDAGLAVQNMSAEAQLLGYGTKIMTSTTMSLNGSNQAEFKELLGIPEDMTAVCVLMIGNVDTENYDVVTSATTRNPIEEVVTFVE